MGQAGLALRGAWSRVLFLSNTEEFTSFPHSPARCSDELGSQNPGVKTPPGGRRLLRLEAGKVADHCGGEWGERESPEGRRGFVEQVCVVSPRGCSLWPGPAAVGLATRSLWLSSGSAHKRARDQGLVSGVSCRLPFRPPLVSLLNVARCCPCASWLGGECLFHLIHKLERYVQFSAKGQKVEGPSPILSPQSSHPCPCTKESHSSRRGRYI